MTPKGKPVFQVSNTSHMTQSPSTMMGIMGTDTNMMADTGGTQPGLVSMNALGEGAMQQQLQPQIEMVESAHRYKSVLDTQSGLMRVASMVCIVFLAFFFNIFYYFCLGLGLWFCCFSLFCKAKLRKVCVCVIL